MNETLKISEVISQTLHYPLVVFDSITFSRGEINNALKKFRSIFNDKDLKLAFNNPHYGQFLRLIAISYREDRTKKWIDYLINEFKRLHTQYKPSHNLILGGNLITFLSYSNENMNNVLAQILFKSKYSKSKKKGITTILNNILTQILLKFKFSKSKKPAILTYEKLTSDQQKQVDYHWHCLKEIKSLADVVRLRMSHLKEIFDTKSLLQFGLIQLLDIYSLIEKIHLIVRNLYGIKILNKYLKEYRFLRNSIAHSHFAYTEITDIQVIQYEYYNVNDKNHSIIPFERRPLNIAVDMLLHCTILCQVLVLYQLIHQTKAQRKKKD